MVYSAISMRLIWHYHVWTMMIMNCTNVIAACCFWYAWFALWWWLRLGDNNHGKYCDIDDPGDVDGDGGCCWDVAADCDWCDDVGVDFDDEPGDCDAYSATWRFPEWLSLRVSGHVSRNRVSSRMLLRVSHVWSRVSVCGDDDDHDDCNTCIVEGGCMWPRVCRASMWSAFASMCCRCWIVMQACLHLFE